jgi:LPXTG-motif cell wall-anchored protein
MLAPRAVRRTVTSGAEHDAASERTVVATVAFSIPTIVADRMTTAQALEPIAGLALPVLLAGAAVVVRRRRRATLTRP